MKLPKIKMPTIKMPNIGEKVGKATGPDDLAADAWKLCGKKGVDSNACKTCLN